MRSGVILALAVAASLSFGISHAQTIPDVTLNVNSDVFEAGDVIRVTGVIAESHSGAVTMQLIAPNGNVVAVHQALPEGRHFSWDIPAQFKYPGTYTVLAQYSLSAHSPQSASASFAYTVAEKGAVLVDGTEYIITYVGDPISGSYTDPQGAILVLEFNQIPASGILVMPPELYEGELIAIEGGMFTELEGGSFAYRATAPEILLAADSVVVPEFGAMAMLIAGIGGAGSVIMRRYVR